MNLHIKCILTHIHIVCDVICAPNVQLSREAAHILGMFHMYILEEPLMK